MVLGIDIGAHKIAAVVWDKEVKESKLEEYPNNIASDYNTWISWVRDWLSSFSQTERRGVCVAGIAKDGVVVKSPNLPILDGIDIGQELNASVVENDANSFLWAENQLGVARGMKSVVGITIGTGIGGGILIDGVLYKGTRGSSGEFGHMIISENKTFEMLAGSKGFNGKNTKKLADEARNGSQDAQNAFLSAGKWLGRGLANIVNIFDPEAIVVGGGISGAWDLLEKPARAEMERFIISPASKKTKLLKTQLGDFAPAIGVALMVGN